MPHKISFKHAFDGIIYCLKTQPNFRVHLVAGTLAILVGLYFNISYIEFLVLLFTIALVITTEMVNTAIESMTDLITEKYHQQAKIAKDVAAGMVLMTAILSVVVGIFIFLPHILGMH